MASIKECIEDGHLKLANGKSIPVISGACNQHRELPLDHGMPVGTGFVGDTKVQVLRDTGCSSAAVRDSLVQSGQMTGDVHTCVLIDGTVRQFPIARIQVDTPFYEGEIEAI